MEGTHPAFTLVLALAVGVLAQSAARHLRIPGIVLLLLAGAGLGPDGLGWVEPRNLGDGLFAVVDVAVAVILFEGGLNLEISRLRREQAPIRNLVTRGAVVTALGGAAAAYALFDDWSWRQAALFGTLVIVTGPTVVSPLIRQLRLRTRVATVLEAEGVLIDPIGAIIAVLMLEVALAPTADSLTLGAAHLLYQLGFGALAGAAAGYLIARLLRVSRLVPEGHENIFVLASVLLLYMGCDQVVLHSGILAVTVAGVVVGNLKSRVDRDLREFKDQLTVMLIGLLFVLLAASVRLADVRELGFAGAGVVGVLVFAVRPLNVWISTLGSELSGRERWLIAWIAPRGIVAAAIAALTAGAMEGAGLPGGAELRALVFLVIACTVVLAGLTAGPVATLLGQRLPGRETVAILGASGLGLALGQQLRAAGHQVVFLDSNPQNTRLAQESEFPVIFGDAMKERTMLRARPEAVGAVVGVTPNQTLNSVFVSQSRERFGVPRGFVAVQKPGAGLAPELVASEVAFMLFEGPHDVERWDVRWRHDNVSVEPWVYSRPPERAEAGDDGGKGEKEGKKKEAPSPGETCVILTVRRGAQTSIMHAAFKLQTGDIASIAIHETDRERATEVLRQLGWTPHVEEQAEAAGAPEAAG